MLTSAGQRAVQVKPDVWGPHVSDTGANPALTRALTRYGAHCQRHGVSLTGSLVLMTAPRHWPPEFGRRRPETRWKFTGVALRAAAGRAKGTDRKSVV